MALLHAASSSWDALWIVVSASTIQSVIALRFGRGPAPYRLPGRYLAARLPGCRLDCDGHHGAGANIRLFGRRRAARGAGDDWNRRDRYQRPIADVLGYIEPRALGYRYLIATGGSSAAADFIVATGRAVIPIGGYTGTVPAPTLTELSALVVQHELRYVFATFRRSFRHACPQRCRVTVVWLGLATKCF